MSPMEDLRSLLDELNYLEDPAIGSFRCSAMALYAHVKNYVQHV